MEYGRIADHAICIDVMSIDWILFKNHCNTLAEELITFIQPHLTSPSPIAMSFSKDKRTSHLRGPLFVGWLKGVEPSTA